MYLALDADEQEIANAAADFLGNEFPLRRLHACPEDPNSLKHFAELGWLGLAAPEMAGGSGLGPIEEMVFFLALGRVVGPMQVLFQTLAIAIAQNNCELSESLIAGEVEVALLAEQYSDGSARIIGSVEAAYAVEMTPKSAGLYTMTPGDTRPVPCLDRSVAMSMMNASGLQQVVTIDAAPVWQRARIIIAAMQLGLAETALAMIVEYAKERQTFGRPIGTWQAVRHPCADMAVRIEGARSQLFYAATALKEAHSDVDMQIAAALMLAERAARENTDANIQLHGGIGVTDEHDAHLLMKRANLLRRLAGSSKPLRENLLQGGEN